MCGFTAKAYQVIQDDKAMPLSGHISYMVAAEVCCHTFVAACFMWQLLEQQHNRRRGNRDPRCCCHQGRPRVTLSSPPPDPELIWAPRNTYQIYPPWVSLKFSIGAEHPCCFVAVWCFCSALLSIAFVCVQFGVYCLLFSVWYPALPCSLLLFGFTVLVLTCYSLMILPKCLRGVKEV